jgi:hypothetical protein
VKRVELLRVRTCQRCGRGAAELHSDDGDVMVISLDPTRAREFAETNAVDDVRPLCDLMLAQFVAAGLTPTDVVFDLFDGHLRALLSFGGSGEPEVVSCTAEEGLGIAVRGELKLYATDEAVEHASGRMRKHKHERPGGAGGPDVLH